LAIEIVIELSGAKEVEGGIEGVAKSLDKLADAEEKAGKSFSRKSKATSDIDEATKEVGKKVSKAKKKAKDFKSKLRQLQDDLDKAWEKEDETEAAIITEKINRLIRSADKDRTNWEGAKSKQDVLDKLKLDKQKEKEQKELKREREAAQRQKKEFDDLARSKNPDDILKAADLAKSMGLENLHNELVVKARKRNDQINKDRELANAPYPPPPPPPKPPKTPVAKPQKVKAPPIADETRGLATTLRKAQESLARAKAGGIPEHVANAQARLDKAQNAWDRFQTVTPPPKLSRVKAPPVADYAKGAATRLRLAEDNLTKAKATGNPEWIKNAEQKVDMAKRALGSTGFLNNLIQTIGTTRIAFGRLHPLIGRMFQTLMSVNSKLGPYAHLALAAEVATAAYVSAVVIASERIQSATRFQAMTGASNYGSVQNYSGIAGMSPDEFAGSIEKFVDTISSGGIAEGVAARYGVYSAHNALDRSQQDDFKVFQDAVDKVRSMSRKDAVAFSRLTNTPQLMNFYDISKGTYNELMEANRNLVGIKDGQRTMFADINAHMAMAQTYIDTTAQNIAPAGGTVWDSVVGGFDQAVLRPMSEWTSGIPEAANWKGLTDFGTGFVQNAINPISSAMNSVPKDLRETISKEYFQYAIAQILGPLNLIPKSEEKKNKDDLTKEQIDALNNNTRELKNSRELFGGGRKAIDAIPASVRWNVMSDHDYSNSIRMGAVNV